MDTWLKSAMNQVMEELENERWATVNYTTHDPSLSVRHLPSLPLTTPPSHTLEQTTHNPSLYTTLTEMPLSHYMSSPQTVSLPQGSQGMCVSFSTLVLCVCVWVYVCVCVSAGR